MCCGRSRVDESPDMRQRAKRSCGMPSKSKNDYRADRSILALLSAYQECPVTSKLMTSQVVQRARPLTGHIRPVRSQRVNMTKTSRLLQTWHVVRESKCGIYPGCFSKTLYRSKQSGQSKTQTGKSYELSFRRKGCLFCSYANWIRYCLQLH